MPGGHWESWGCGRGAALMGVQGLSMSGGCSPKAGGSESSGEAEQPLDVFINLQW